MYRFTMRIEVWEKDEGVNECFSEYGELYFRDEDKYYAYENGNLVEIPNPFKDRLSLKEFNKAIHQIYNNDENSGSYIPTNEVLSVDGYPIHSIDIIFKEENVFPYVYNTYYDDNNFYHRDLKIDYYELIDEIKNIEVEM